MDLSSSTKVTLGLIISIIGGTLYLYGSVASKEYVDNKNAPIEQRINRMSEYNQKQFEKFDTKLDKIYDTLLEMKNHRK